MTGPFKISFNDHGFYEIFPFFWPVHLCFEFCLSFLEFVSVAFIFLIIYLKLHLLATKVEESVDVTR